MADLLSTRRPVIWPLLLVIVATGPWPEARAGDPLDQVSGTEGWTIDQPQSISDEWKDWYRARIRWRKAGRELRVQRTRSRGLAQLLRRRSGGPDPALVRRVLRSRAVGADAAGAADVDEAGGRPRRGGTPRSGGARDPPAWIKVPVERLDHRGQALDEEGDQELKRVIRRRRGRSP